MELMLSDSTTKYLRKQALFNNDINEMKIFYKFVVLVTDSGTSRIMQKKNSLVKSSFLMKLDFQLSVTFIPRP